MSSSHYAMIYQGWDALGDMKQGHAPSLALHRMHIEGTYEQQVFIGSFVFCSSLDSLLEQCT